MPSFTESRMNLPISKLLTDLHEAEHTSLSSEITIDGLINLLVNFDATIPSTPGANFYCVHKYILIF